MRTIKEYVDELKEEIEGAENYAEKYVECKAAGHIERANKYKEMARDELRHAENIHQWAVAKIEEVSKIYTPPAEMEEAWRKAHKEYVKHVAEIKIMLEI